MNKNFRVCGHYCLRTKQKQSKAKTNIILTNRTPCFLKYQNPVTYESVRRLGVLFNHEGKKASN